MALNFEFATATQILFGAGKLRDLSPTASTFGTKGLIITGSRPSVAKPLTENLANRAIGLVQFTVVEEPTTDIILQGLSIAREEHCDFVIACGGGSVLDAGKAIAALLNNKGNLFDYLEVVGLGKSLEKPPVPFIAIPTTAGTGSEVTRNAVLSVPDKAVKVSLRSPWMLPRLAVIDPQLTCDLPPHLTATTGLDALTQLIEPFVSHRANPLTDSLCREGMIRVARSFETAFASGSDLKAREDMAIASLFGGLALANAGLGAVHGFAAPIGGMFHAPHGGVCAALLPAAMEMNISASLRKNQTETADRFREVARLLTGIATATEADGVRWVRNLCKAMGIPALRAYGIERQHVPDIVAKAEKASSMKGNPVVLSQEELTQLLLASL